MQTIIQQPGHLADVMPVQPAVSVILPFEPHLRSKTVIENEFQACISKAIAQIGEDYQTALGALVVSRLKKIFSQLNFSSFRKSVAIFVSPVFEKIIYMPFEVQPMVTVSSGFDIRQAIKARVYRRSFLLVNLGRYASNIFLSDGKSLARVNMNMHDDEKKDLFPKAKAFTDRNELREILLRGFMRRTDQALQLLLKAYPLPVFITGSPKVTGEFRKISTCTSRIVRYIHGYFTKANEQRLKEMLTPLLNDWQEIQQKDLLQRLNAAANAEHLAVGIREVWKNATARNASLLVIEENYIPAAILQPVRSETSLNTYSLVNNIIDEIIEKVLEAGGDIELVKPGTLAGYEPIVLIERYSSKLHR